MGFRLDYDQVIRRTNEMRDLSDELGREINRLNNVLGAINSDWSGPASSEFQKQLSQLIERLSKSKRTMSEEAEQIRSQAAKIKAEDDRQAELAAALAAATAAVTSAPDKKSALGGGGSFGGR